MLDKTHNNITQKKRSAGQLCSTSVVSRQSQELQGLQQTRGSTNSWQHFVGETAQEGRWNAPGCQIQAALSLRQKAIWLGDTGFIWLRLTVRRGMVKRPTGAGHSQQGSVGVCVLTAEEKWDVIRPRRPWMTAAI